jgi:nickel-dependent lactate racemase
LYKFELKEYADIVLVSGGGYPKDINMYSAQKRCDNARFAGARGWSIILVASCPETYGSPTFERWIRNAESPAQIIRILRENFELGGHKAAAIALLLSGDGFLGHGHARQVDESLFFKPMPSVEAR